MDVGNRPPLTNPHTSVSSIDHPLQKGVHFFSAAPKMVEIPKNDPNSENIILGVNVNVPICPCHHEILRWNSFHLWNYNDCSSWNSFGLHLFQVLLNRTTHGILMRFILMIFI